MSISLKLLLNYILLTILLISLVACSTETEVENIEPEVAQLSLGQQVDTFIYVDTANTFNYDSWETAHFQNIKIVFPPNHPFSAQMLDNAKLFKTVLRRNSAFFRLSEPTDSIVVFFYTGFGQGQEIANSEFPTARGDSIYYWSGNRFGVTATMHALHRWTDLKTQYNLIHNGLFRLLDASGRDYHGMTLSYIDSSRFKTLENLVTDERMDFLAEAYQSAEAASFIDYFVYKFGIDKFKKLYESEDTFANTIQTICNMNVNSLEKEWIHVVRLATQNYKQNK